VLSRHIAYERSSADIKQYSEYFTFQQDEAPAHRARETVELLKVETPDFIPPNLWPPNSPDLNPVDYKIWAYCKNGFTRQALTMSTSYDARLLRNVTSWTRALIKQLQSGERYFERVLLQVEDSLDTKCEHLSFLIFCVGIF